VTGSAAAPAESRKNSLRRTFIQPSRSNSGVNQA
jgi:hypothetical protein